jgi:hypothetical protein
MTLRDDWEAHAGQWIRWARAPGHDSYWRFHRDQFLRLLPPPGRLGAFDYSDVIERDGLSMTFCSRHRSLESYFLALEEAGFVVEALREPRVPDHAADTEAERRWQRLPLFLHIRARRDGAHP